MPCHDKGSNAKLELWATDELHPGSGDVDHDEFDVYGPGCAHASFFMQGHLSQGSLPLQYRNYDLVDGSWPF